ncbi:MAG TPA: cupin domain-containing protein [Candidatus Saccharimonadia bacterium]|nr:cupin domain-containing protein [Candidatus Saccharimonadia bacterium]
MKYRVESLPAAQSALRVLHAKKTGQGESRHYYAQQTSNDVVKLVTSADHCEIHMLKEWKGTFTLTRSIPMPNEQASLRWLISQGYDEVSIVAMTHTDYAYRGGIVGLYNINDALHSLILEYPSGEHAAAAKALGIADAEIIAMPYNKYLLQRNQLHVTNIDDLLVTESKDQRTTRILQWLKTAFPGKDSYDLDGRGQHFVCEVEPVSEHPEYDRATEVILVSKPHVHRKMTQYYTVQSGTLELHDGAKTFILEAGNKHVVAPGNVHWAKSNDEAIVEIYSEPGWTKEDHVPVDLEEL